MFHLNASFGKDVFRHFFGWPSVNRPLRLF